MNIELPKDAEGREIPLDTKALYGKDGEGLDVRHFEFSPFSGKWIIAALKGGPCNWTGVYRSPQNVHLEKPAPPDSWEKLLEDLDNTAKKASSSIYIATPCAWFSDGNRHCADCPADEPPEDTCGVKLIKDIAARIRKLRGEER
ncbi:hypothetical protein [Collinsella bouchesdurhonensis]|uniref:hypothetical protein n=1 Tax=Collinsella bouchesdurhonensis TaxID=1907654 RepID=UPI0034A2C7D5